MSHKEKLKRLDSNLLDSYCLTLDLEFLCLNKKYIRKLRKIRKYIQKSRVLLDTISDRIY